LKKNIFSRIIALIVLALSLSGCALQEDQAVDVNLSADDGLSIVTTIFPAYDFARAVAGDAAQVNMLVPAGAEIHSFEPTPADIIAISEADVIVYIGGESESWVDSVLQSIDTNSIKIVKLIDTVTPEEEELVEGMGEEHKHELKTEEVEYDEHIWTSPQNAVKMVQAVSDALCNVDKDNEIIYQNNAASYIEQISQIDEAIQQIVSSAKRKVLVFGDRFPFLYFAKEFGLSYRAAFPGCSSETETSAATMAHLIDYVQTEKIPYIYYIELSNQNVAKAIAEQTRAGLLLLHSCHNVTKSDFEAGVTYVSLMRQNIENLQKGLN